VLDIRHTVEFDRWLRLLCGGDKKSQARDIKLAKALAMEGLAQWR